MDKIKPYLFWLISGILLLAFVIIALVVEPTVTKGNRAQTVQDYSEALERKYQRQLSGQLAKANHAQQPVFDFRKEEPFKTLEEQYLVGKEWKRPFTQIRDDYQSQIENLLALLKGKSAYLHQDQESGALLGQSGSRDAWNRTYQSATGKLLQELYQANQLVMPRGQASDDWYKDADLREPFGVMTREEGLPNETEQRLLARRYRIIEAIAKALRESQVQPYNNPAVHEPEAGVELAPEIDGPLAPKLAGVEWAGEIGEMRGRFGRGASAGGMQDGAVVPIHGGEALLLELELQGSVSALMEVARYLEEHPDIIVQVRGADWGRGPADQRTGQPDAPAAVTYQLSVLDYQHCDRLLKQAQQEAQ